MATSSSSSSSTKPSDKNISTTKNTSWPLTLLIITLILPTFLAVIVYQLESFDPGEYPIHELTQYEPLLIRNRNGNMIKGSEKVGFGKLLAPEDLAYDAKSGLIYTGCGDGWVKRVKVTDSVADSVVEDWVNTGGRPLGLVRGHHGEVIIADADKGLLNVSIDGVTHLLTDEAEGLKFKLTDAVDVANNGILYFTDASYKYKVKDYMWDFIEGRPHGRLLSYDPSTKLTRVLVRDLYFANGVVVSPDQKSVIVCETPLSCCKRYYIDGEKKGSVEMFIANLPGLPDNIRYDGDGNYWIALSTERTYLLDLALRYPSIRKVMAIMEKSIGIPQVQRNGGALAVDLQGKPIAHYHDHDLSLISSSIKIGDHLYCGSLGYPYIIRLNITQHPAVSALD